jgi:flavin reductase (DIM6/NTAB) family NADH-FMN oxidoreductase RutF
MIFTSNSIQEMEKLMRVQLITSLPGAKPICLVGTRSAAGVSNLAPFSSIVHLGSNPPLIGMVTRPDSVERNTLNNILETRCWTLSHVSSLILQQAHQCSARYPKEVSEFEATGLAERTYEAFFAPAVSEARIKYGLELEDVLEIKANNVKLIIGKVAFIEIDDELLKEDGGIDLIAADSLASTALDTYFTLGTQQQLPYAKASEYRLS